jgi:hypothetical protein
VGFVLEPRMILEVSSPSPLKHANGPRDSNRSLSHYVPAEVLSARLPVNSALRLSYPTGLDNAECVAWQLNSAWLSAVILADGMTASRRSTSRPVSLAKRGLVMPLRARWNALLSLTRTFIVRSDVGSNIGNLGASLSAVRTCSMWDKGKRMLVGDCDSDHMVRSPLDQGEIRGQLD